MIATHRVKDSSGNIPGGHGDKFDTIPIFTVGARFPYR